MGLNSRLLSVFFTLTITSSAHAQLANLWHYDSVPGGVNWRTVSIGANGSQIISNPNGGSGSTVLLSSNKVPNSPLIWADNTTALTSPGFVRAAADSDKYATLYFESTGIQNQWIPKLKFYRSNSGSPLWVKSFAPIQAMAENLVANVHVAKNGSRIIAWWFNQIDSQTYHVGFTEAGLSTFSVSINTGMPVAATTNEDVSRLIMVLSNMSVVIDGSSGAILQIVQTWYNPLAAIAMTPSGDTVAIGSTSGSIDVYRSNGSSLLGIMSIPGSYIWQPSRAAISADGSTLAVAFRSLNNLFEWKIRVFAVGATSGTQIYETGFVGLGGFSAFVTDLVMSRSGDVIAVGTGGDEIHSIPSILVLKRTAGVFTVDATEILPGSVTDLDISADGTTLAVASSAYHFQQTNYLGYVSAYDLGADIRVVGMPHAGSTITLEHKAVPGQAVLFLMSNSLASTPISYGVIGNLLLNSPTRLGVAIADQSGIARFDYTLPAGVSNYGLNLAFQGMVLLQRRLSTNAASAIALP